jgi:ATP-dependent helicase/nuclease subunit A
MMISLTKTQQAALARDKNIAVTAGAGTGKTLILVERYIDILLKENVDIRELLAITFTNKAAAEMVERVATTIESLLKTSSDKDTHKKLLRIRNHLSSAYISTIHAFCARLLREFPLEAGGLDPGFKQLDEVQSDFLIGESIDVEISQIKNDDQYWLELFRLFGPDKVKDILHTALSHRFEMIHILQRFTDNTPEEIYEELVNSFLGQVSGHFSQSQLSSIQKLVVNLLIPDVQTESFIEEKASVVALLQTFRETDKHDSVIYWRNLFLLADRMTTGKGTAYKNLSQLGKKDAWEPEKAELLLELSRALVPIATWQREMTSSCPGRSDLIVLQNLRKLYELYDRVNQRFSELKRNQISVDYEDLQIFVFRLLQEHDQIRSQVSARFKYMMVDEFQDTNQLQWEIVSLLTQDKRDKLFIVGDPKQSIYGFRDADVRVFNQVKLDFAARYPGSNHLLFESFRFKNVISYFINDIFPDILKTSPDNPWEVAYDRVETRREDAEGGQVELAILKNGGEGNVQAGFMANRILDILAVGVYKPGHIALLLRTRNHLSEVEKELRNHDIPFQTAGGMGFYQGQEIFDTFHLLRFLINPLNDLALIGLLRSPFADISDQALFFMAAFAEGDHYWEKLQRLPEIEHLPDEDKERLQIFTANARRWIDRRDRVGYFELLAEIFHDSLYRAVVSADLMGEQIIANIEKILKITMAFEKGSFSSVVDFADSLDRLINTYLKEGKAPVELEQEETVKILTIHQAKGLEFPVVFLPFLEQQINFFGQRSEYFDDYYGMTARIQNSREGIQDEAQGSYYLYDWLKLNKKRKEIAELKRLFYVGCTRARDQLILSGEIKKDKVPDQTPLHWLLNSLNISAGQLPEGRFLVEKDIDLLIHTDYTKKPTTEESKIKNTFRSIEQISKISPTDGEDPNKPAFLRSTIDYPKGEIFSATQIMTFLENPQEYHQRYHLGFFEDDYDKLGLGFSEEEDALLRGTLIHRLMEQYPKDDIDQLLTEMDIVDQRMIRDLKKDVSLIKDRIRVSPVIQPALQAAEFRNEVSILKKIGTDFLTGTLDRIYKNDRDEWEIIDYKSNRIVEKDLMRAVAGYQVQMEIYALLLANVFPEQHAYKIGLYFVYPDKLSSHEYNPARIEKMEKKYGQVIETIKQFYPYTSKLVI